MLVLFQVPVERRLMTCVTHGDNFNHTIRQIQLPSKPILDDFIKHFTFRMALVHDSYCFSNPRLTFYAICSHFYRYLLLSSGINSTDICCWFVWFDMITHKYIYSIPIMHPQTQTYSMRYTFRVFPSIPKHRS